MVCANIGMANKAIAMIIKVLRIFFIILMIGQKYKIHGNWMQFSCKFFKIRFFFAFLRHKDPYGMKKIEVKNFKLYTTAVISIEWKQDLLNVNLDLAMMLKMMHMEGLTEADIERYSQNGQPIPFKKVTLILFQDDNKPGQYYTDESFDEEDDPTVFYVEIKE